MDEIDAFELVTDDYYDVQQCIVDNSANAHIWPVLSDFVPGTMRKFPINPTTGVLTIGSSGQHTDSIGDIKVSWLDLNGITYKKILKDALYFPYITS